MWREAGSIWQHSHVIRQRAVCVLVMTPWLKLNESKLVVVVTVDRY